MIGAWIKEIRTFALFAMKDKNKEKKGTNLQ
jgi:hypothetical protein